MLIDEKVNKWYPVLEKDSKDRKGRPPCALIITVFQDCQKVVRFLLKEWNHYYYLGHGREDLGYSLTSAAENGKVEMVKILSDGHIPYGTIWVYNRIIKLCSPKMICRYC